MYAKSDFRLVMTLYHNEATAQVILEVENEISYQRNKKNCTISKRKKIANYFAVLL